MATAEKGTFVVRDARPDELDKVARVLKAAYEEYSRHMPPDAWEAYLRNIMDVRGRAADSEQIVAVRGGKVLGAITFYPQGPGSAQETWPEGWVGLRLLGTHPRYRGLGVGKALMQECIRRARAARAVAVGLHTTGLMVAARDMYERMGFVRAPELDFHPAPGIVVMAYRMKL